jgi:YD repeat-containing protein
MPRVIQVIESEVTEGEDIGEDRCRVVRKYHSLDGVLLAENDPGRKPWPQKYDESDYLAGGYQIFSRLEFGG